MNNKTRKYQKRRVLKSVKYNSQRLNLEFSRMNKYLTDQNKPQNQIQNQQTTKIQTFKISPIRQDLFIPHQKSGWLSKMGKGNTRWKKRWVVLGDGFLKYYKTDSNLTEAVPLGKVNLPMIIGVLDLSKIWEKPHVFSIVLRDRMYVLRGDCQEECQDWITILKISLAFNTIIRRKVRKEDQELIRLLLLSLDRLETRLGLEKTKISNSLSQSNKSKFKAKKNKNFPSKNGC